MSKAENQNNSQVRISPRPEHHIGILEKIMERIEKESWTNFCRVEKVS